MSATSINKLVGAMFGENFTGKVEISLKKNHLKVVSGQTEMSAVTDGVIYQLPEAEIAVLKDGDFIANIDSGFVCSIDKAPVKPAATKPPKTVTGGRSSSRPERKFD